MYERTRLFAFEIYWPLEHFLWYSCKIICYCISWSRVYKNTYSHTFGFRKNLKFICWHLFGIIFSLQLVWNKSSMSLSKIWARSEKKPKRPNNRRMHPELKARTLCKRPSINDVHHFCLDFLPLPTHFFTIHSVLEWI